jgi:hypothetical protein
MGFRGLSENQSGGAKRRFPKWEFLDMLWTSLLRMFCMNHSSSILIGRRHTRSQPPAGTPLSVTYAYPGL